MSARHAALLGLLAALWGSSYLLIKYALDGFSPAEIVFGRAALAACVLVPLCALRGGTTRARLADARRRPGVALGLGTLFVAAPFELISFGELHVPSGLTAILIAPSPIFVALLALAFDPSERLAGRGWVGLAVGLSGVALLVGVESVSSLATFLGSMGILLASACYAGASYVVKTGYRGFPPLVTSAFAVSAAALVTLPVALLAPGAGSPDAGDWAALVALGVTHTALAFLIFYELIGAVGAGRANLVSYLTPPFALVYGAVLLSERVTVAALVGLGLILAGVTLASRRRAPVEVPVSGAHADAEGRATRGETSARVG